MGMNAFWIKHYNSDAILLNWGRWSLEPAGAGWNDSVKELKEIDAALLQAAEKRTSLTGVRPEQVKLAALTYAFETRCQRQQFNEALELLVRMLDYFTVLNES